MQQPVLAQKSSMAMQQNCSTRTMINHHAPAPVPPAEQPVSPAGVEVQETAESPVSAGAATTPVAEAAVDQEGA